MAYGRFNRKYSTVVLINNNDYEVEKKVSVWETGVPKESTITKIFESNDSGYSMNQEGIPVISGKITIKLPRFSATLLRYVKPEEEPEPAGRSGLW